LYPTDYRGSTIAGFAILLAAFGGFSLWAALMPLSSAVLAVGTVIVDSHRKTIEHLEGGVVAELGVREGVSVEAGQVLLELDATQLLASREVLRTRLATERARAARLLSEQAEAEAVRFPPDLQVQGRGDLEIAKILGGQAAIFATREASLAGEIGILRRRQEQLRIQIEGFKKQAAAQVAELALVREELDAIRGLEARGHAPKSRRLALEREKEQIEGSYAATLASLGRDREALGETDLEITQVGRRFQESVAAELREAQAAEHDVREQLRAVDDQLGRTVLRAPVAGRVVGLRVHGAGAVVETGEALMDIVPAHEPLLIEAQVAPGDIQNVQLGQSAELRFAAFRGRTAPIIDGRVVLVSADSLLEPATRTPYYAVRVEVPEEELAKLGADASYRPLIPGMPAEVIILAGERTLLDYLIEPLTDTFRLAFREK
jgi:HlyD family type I secretion membrane fusion protein